MARDRQDHQDYGLEQWELLTSDSLLNRMTNRIRRSLELPEILAATVTEMRAFLQTDRVKVYRFEPDASGEVVAESVNLKELPSLSGLHFPAEDIPPHAREMFVKARQRSIISIPEQQIMLSRSELVETTGDLTIETVLQHSVEDLLRRPVDPCHVEYLTAMGVQSSLVVPILYQNQLWGLLVSHHAQPKAFSPKDLQIVEMIADHVSIAIAQSYLLSQARSKARREALINQIVTLLHAPLQMAEILQVVLERIVKALGGSGGRLHLQPTLCEAASTLHVCGAQPDLSACDRSLYLEDYPFWQQFYPRPSAQFSPVLEDVEQLTDDLVRANRDEDLAFDRTLFALQSVTDLYQEPQLEELVPAFQPTRIRSLLLMPIRYGQHELGCLTIYRDEIDTDILWAGRFDPDVRNFRVHASFEAWREIKQGQTQDWTDEDLDLARSLGTHLAMAIMQNRLYQCEREQRLLVEMRNQELHTARTVAEEANLLKSNFLSSTSHELRTPLASTLNYLKLLKDELYDNPEELQEYINIAHQSTENLVAIINDVLDIAKIEAGRMNVNLELINLCDMLDEQAALFRPESRQKNIPLLIDCAPEAESLYGDKTKLRQVLTNLISNAFKFTNEGEVRIQARRCTVETTSMIEVLVSDTGIGIDRDRRDLLFEPFVQADGSIKRRYGGTGLGLTVCKRLVELMQGQIWIGRSVPQQGTTMIFRLPAGLTPAEQIGRETEGLQ